MIRRMFSAVVFMSTMLLLVVLILWPVSYCREVGVSFNNKSSFGVYHDIGGMSGRFYVEVLTRSYYLGFRFFARKNTHDDYFGGYTAWSYSEWGPNKWTIPPHSSYLGVRIDDKNRPQHSLIAVPFSYLAMLFSILPVILFFRRFCRYRRHTKGLCPTCSYDLRAHTPGTKCPECGTMIAETKIS